MRYFTLILIALFPAFCFAGEEDSTFARKIFDEALTKGRCYEMLDVLCNDIGARLSGSPEAARAVEWGKREMEKHGFDRVFLQEVMVPHWIRGDVEKGVIYTSDGKENRKVPICALGGSISTPEGGIKAEVVEVHGFDELKALGKTGINGKIVFFNRPMDPKLIITGPAYGGAVNQRHKGAAESVKYGALGVIVRSMTLALDDVPHTGSMKYDSAGVKIPAAAISTKGADYLSVLLKTDPNAMFHLELSCQTLPDEKSFNVIGEIKGSEKPEEIILVGGHLDSWDLGHGAHDDGAGCVQAIEALRLFKALNIKPKRTIRAVLFMNEENGLRGGKKYAELAKKNGENHIAAIESDAGGFTPRGFGISANASDIEKVQRWNHIFEDYDLLRIEKGWGGADITPLKEQGTVLIGYRPDSQRYFDYHHSSIDTFDKVNKRELELGAASIATLLYFISEYGL